MNSSRKAFSSILHGRLYAVGPSNTTEFLDLATSEWKRGFPLKDNINAECSVTVSEDEIMTIGGLYLQKTTGSLFIALTLADQ